MRRNNKSLAPLFFLCPLYTTEFACNFDLLTTLASTKRLFFFLLRHRHFSHIYLCAMGHTQPKKAQRGDCVASPRLSPPRQVTTHHATQMSQLHEFVRFLAFNITHHDIQKNINVVAMIRCFFLPEQ